MSYVQTDIQTDCSRESLYSHVQRVKSCLFFFCSLETALADSLLDDFVFLPSGMYSKHMKLLSECLFVCVSVWMGWWFVVVLQDIN